jgi:acetyl esterase/lipase
MGNSPVQTTDIVDFRNDQRLSRGTRAFLNVLNTPVPPELEKLAPAAARKVLETAQASVNVDYSGIDERQKTITADAFEIALDIVRPKGAAGRLPAFIFIHGGGWVLGDYPTHRRLVRDLVVESGYCGVFVNYTRTPDAVFPRQIDEIYAATRWVAQHGSEIDVDGGNLAVVGNSVGGNMTAVTAIKAKENGGPAIKAQIIMWPVADADFETGSFKEFGRDRFLSAPLMQWMWDLYIADPAKRRDIHASPLRASLEQLKGLPPALIQVAENDILRDEGEAYGRRLDEAGVEATTIRYDGMIHDFGLLNALANEPATRSLFRHAAAELRNRLG